MSQPLDQSLPARTTTDGGAKIHTSAAGKPLDQERIGLFVQQITECQSRLYAFLCTLLGRSEDAQDVLQETNTALWKKMADFDPDRPFLPWAYQFAHMQVLAHRKRQQRDRLIFDDEMLEVVSHEVAQQDVQLERQVAALEGCLKKLPPKSRTLLERRYRDQQSVCDLATELRQSANAVSALLYRLRRTLQDCVQSTLATKEPL